MLRKYTDHPIAPHLGLFLLRLAFGTHLIYGVLDNLLSAERMWEFRHFLDQHNFSFPLFMAWISVLAQFLAGLSWIIGWQVRTMSLIMIFNFSIALIMVHWGDTYQSLAPALQLWVVSAFLFLNGSGKWGLGGRHNGLTA